MSMKNGYQYSPFSDMDIYLGQTRLKMAIKRLTSLCGYWTQDRDAEFFISYPSGFRLSPE
jgi:hypothetical protein